MQEAFLKGFLLHTMALGTIRMVLFHMPSCSLIEKAVMGVWLSILGLQSSDLMGFPCAILSIKRGGNNSESVAPSNISYFLTNFGVLK